MTDERHATRTSLIHAFIALQATGAVGLTILLLTSSISRRIHRDLTWYSFCLTWVISCLSYLLLPLAGQQYEHKPNHTLCLTQASLVYASPTLTACSTLALVVQIWLNAGSASIGTTSRHQRVNGPITLVLLAAPYAISLVVLIASLLVAVHWPESVYRAKNGVYCKMKIGLPGQVSAILVAVVMGAAVLFEVYIAYMLYRSWRLLKSLDAHTKHTATTALRIGIFTLFSTLSIVVAPVYLSASMESLPNIIIALTPVCAFLIFGSQTDLLQVWTFRKPLPPTLETIEDCDHDIPPNTV